MGPAWTAAAAAQAAATADAIGALADASQAWADAIGSAFVDWAMAQAQADADFGIAGAIAGATAGRAAAAAGTIYSSAVSKAAGDLTRALNAVQAGFVDAATAASLEATKTIAAAETVERKAVAKADVALAKDLQAAWGTYASAERSAVTLNARERATIGADYKKEVAGAELTAVRAVAPARKTSMVDAADANGVYHVKVTGIIADLGILGGQIKVEQVKASQTLISPATLKKWLDSLSTWSDTIAAFGKGLAQGVANLGNVAQDIGIGILNTPAASVNFGSWASETLFFDVPDHMKIRLPYIPSPDWSKGLVTQESDFDHNVSKGSLVVAVGIFGSGAVGKLGIAGRGVVAPGSRLTMSAGARVLAQDVAHYAKNVTAVDGFTDVFIHGMRNGEGFAVLHGDKWVELSHRQLATWLGHQGVKGDIRLMSCHSGALEVGSVAQNLANKLGVTVMAPTNAITVHANGKITAIAGTIWKTFKPGVRS